jgi:D-alanine transaminase
VRIGYVNGRFEPLGRRAIAIEDRGFQFGDAIYEVWAVRDGVLFDAEGHFRRLARSLGEVRIAAPMSERALLAVMKETLRKNRVNYGVVYVQISRGVASRDHAFPAKAKPTLVVTAKPLDRNVIEARAEKGIAVITLPDERWRRCDIKSVNLLPNVLAKQKARESGAFEAWLLDGDGFVTEGTSSNAWIVDAAGRLRTRPLSHHILPGITRAALLKLAESRRIELVEEPFTQAEAEAAREAFLTSAANAAMPVISINGKVLGDGKPGPIARALRRAYLASMSE